MKQKHTIESKTELFHHVVEKVACPTCNARSGCECVTSSGRPTEPHLSRHVKHLDVCSQ